MAESTIVGLGREYGLVVEMLDPIAADGPPVHVTVDAGPRLTVPVSEVARQARTTG